ncbi:MAG: GGDEF domain-containing protein [Nitrosomonadales bacterium]|nr:GGDEF domain-containing protein [Nitrosomonadales bacterium]
MNPHVTEMAKPPLIACTIKKCREYFSIVWVLPALVLLITLVATALLWRVEQQNAVKNMQIDFDFRVREANTRIERRIIAYEQILRGVKALLVSSPDVTREEFRSYTESLRLEDNYPGSHNIGFARVVPEAHSGARGGESQVNGAITTSVAYLEPLLDLEPFSLGSNLYADPVRRAAMEQARDTGQAVNSGKVLLPLTANEDPNIQRGFVLFLPVYKTGAPHATVAERRANLAGWVYASFRSVDLMSDILGSISGEVDIEIHDGDSLDDESMLYDPDLSGPGGNPDAIFKSSRKVEVANHYWTVVIRSLYAFEMRVDRTKAQFVAYVGIVTGLLLAMLAWLMVWSKMRAMRAAEALGHELAERKRAEEGLRLAATVVKTVEEAVVVTDTNNNIIAVNPAFTVITGYAAEEAIGKNPRLLASGRHSKEFYAKMWEILLATGSWHGEIWDKRKNGDLYIKWLSLRLVRDEQGKITNHVAVFADITERKNIEERMKHLAHYDLLTDLPNRLLFNDTLRQEIARAKRDTLDKRDTVNKKRLGLMFIDLDKFKPVNDTLGHAVGDMLLKEVAKRLLGCMRESDIVARLGGDEFVVLLPNIEAEQDAMMVADKILLSLGQPFELIGHSLHISASIGVVMYPDHGGDEITLTKHADVAMYYAKASGRNNAQLFQPEMLVTGAHCALD